MLAERKSGATPDSATETVALPFSNGGHGNVSKTDSHFVFIPFESTKRLCSFKIPEPVRIFRFVSIFPTFSFDPRLYDLKTVRLMRAILCALLLGGLWPAAAFAAGKAEYVVVVV